VDLLSNFWGNVALGFSVAGTPFNLMLCFIGVFLGTLIGVLPGIGPMTGVALLIPLTFSLKPNAAIILMAGIYYGAMYGGSTTSILVNTPGESSSVVTCLDGYQMAKKGRGSGAGGGGDRVVYRGHLCDPHADAVRSLGRRDRA
jgi:putative tricarboxylic transport membrane protein